MYLLIIPAIIFFIHGLLSSKYFNKQITIITLINCILFGIFFYFFYNKIEGFRDNVDSAFQDEKVYYRDTVPTTDKCDTGDKQEITFYYNNGTQKKHVDASNNSYTCKKITLQPKVLPRKQDGQYGRYGREGYYNRVPVELEEENTNEPIIKYIITPSIIVDTSYNCPESLDYDINKGRCFTPNYQEYRDSCPDYDNVNDACLTPNHDKKYSYDPYYKGSHDNNYTFPKKYKCPHVLGSVHINYPGERRGDDVYHCDFSGNRLLLNNDKTCPNGMRHVNRFCV